MAKKTEQLPDNAFGLGDRSFTMECTQAAQTARKAGRKKVTEASYKLTCKVTPDDLAGTPYFDDVFMVVDPGSGKQMTLDGKNELPAGAV